MKAYKNTCCSRQRIVAIIVVTLFLLSLIPLLIIAVHTRACTDDYSYGFKTVTAWRESGSLVETMKAAGEQVAKTYMDWQGSFSGVFFMALQPAIFGENIYWVSAYILIFGFIVSMFFFLKVVMLNYLKAGKVPFLIVGSMLVFLSLQFLPNPVEAFFWYNGGMYYTGFHSLFLISFSLLLLALHTEKRYQKIIWSVLGCILSFIIGGGNLVTALTTLLIYGTIFFYRLVLKRNRWIVPLSFLLSIGIGFTINSLAPGNAARSAGMEEPMNPIMAVIESFPYSIRFLTKDISIFVTVFVAVLCLIPLFNQISKSCSFSFSYPGVVTIILYCIFTSSFTANIYVLKDWRPGRVANVNFYYYLLFLSFITFYWVGWFNKTNSRRIGFLSRKIMNVVSLGRLLLLGMIVFCCFCAIVSLMQSANSMSSVSAVKSLVNGEASQYQKECIEREKILNDPTILDAKVPGFKTFPHLLYFDDIKPDPHDWRNIAVAEYYNKNTVIRVDE